MSIFYIDPLNGNDANSGADFANAWKTIDTGATAARIAPGDTIRIAKSPDPVALGVTSKWTSLSYPGRVRPTNLVVTGTANNGAGLVRITVADTSTLTTNDVVFIADVTGTLEANGIFKITVIDTTHFDLVGSAYVNAWVSGGTVSIWNDKVIVLGATNLTQTVSNCDTAWTAAGSATLSLGGTTLKEGANSVKIVKASPGNNTLYAYKTIPSTNFSGKQNISLWLRNETAIAATNWKICLCSDTAGTTIVDTFIIPALPVLPAARWWCLTIVKNGGGNLGSAIQSVAFYSGSSGATTAGIFLDNIIATTTNGLDLQKVISKNSSALGGTEPWAPIQSIKDDIVVIDTSTASSPGTSYSYFGTSEVATETYIRDSFKFYPATAAAAVNTTQKAGTAGNYISYEGGYNTTTNTVDGETHFDLLNGLGYGFLVNVNYIKVKNINVIRAGNGIYFNTVNYCELDFNNMTSCTTNGVIFLGTTYCKLDGKNACYNNAGVVMQTSSYVTIGTLKKLNSCNNAFTVNTNFNASTIDRIEEVCGNSTALSIGGQGAIVNYIGKLNYNGNPLAVTSSSNYIYNEIDEISYNNGATMTRADALKILKINNLKGNINEGLRASSNCGGAYFGYINSDGNNGGASAVSLSPGVTTIAKMDYTETVPVTNPNTYFGVQVFISKINGDDDKLMYVTGDGIVETLAATDGTSWNNYVIGAARDSVYPLQFVLTIIECRANVPVTFYAVVSKHHATDISTRLVCKGGQIAGVPTDVTDTKADDTDEELLTITFTPTEDGVVEITSETWTDTGVLTEYATYRSLKSNSRVYGKVYFEDYLSTMKFNYLLQYSGQTTNPFITETNQATVHAYTGLSYDGTLHISGAHTLKEIYDWTQDYLQLNSNVTTFFTTIDGVNYVSIVDIDNTSVITGGGSIDVGTNTYSGGGTYDGIIITSTTRTVPVIISNVVAGSRIQIYNTSDSTELFNEIVSGTTFAKTFDWTADKTIRIRLKYTGASTAYLEYTTSGVITENGFSIVASQVLDTVYAANNVDGSTVTECSISGATIRIYIDDTTNETSFQRVYNWYQYILATSVGIANQDSAYFYAISPVEYRFDPTMKVINQDLTNPLTIFGANIAPTTGTASIIDNSNGACTVIYQYYPVGYTPTGNSAPLIGVII